jgi:hypothetical protein
MRLDGTYNVLKITWTGKKAYPMIRVNPGYNG